MRASNRIILSNAGIALALGLSIIGDAQVTSNTSQLSWDIRKDPFVQSIIDANPDIIGFQEPRQEQVDDLIDGLSPLWNFTSQLTWEGGDCLTTCWNTETTNLIQRRHYFHSETPEELGSIIWNATWPMGTLSTSFRLKSTEEIFWTINTHFDPDSQFAKNKSAELVLGRESLVIKGGDEDELTPPHSMVILFGDLNANETSESYSILTGDRYSYVDPFKTIIEGINPTSKPEMGDERKKGRTFIDLRKEFGSDKQTPTFEAFTIGNRKRKSPKTIDFVMLADNNALKNRNWTVEDVRLLDNDLMFKETRYMVSDHRMMIVELSQ